MANKSARTILSAVFLLILSAPAYGQSERGTLTGTVTDSSGSVIPGASVTATHQNTNVSSRTITTDDGVYVVPALTPGNYKIRVELTGFKAAEQADINVAAGATT